MDPNGWDTEVLNWLFLVCSTIQGVSEGVRSVVREEVEGALQRHAQSPETLAREERSRKQVSPNSHTSTPYSYCLRYKWVEFHMGSGPNNLPQIY